MNSEDEHIVMISCTMKFGQYCRIEHAAGGVRCTDREFIRAARSMMTRLGKSHRLRHTRQAWLRDGLKKLDTNRLIVLGVVRK